MRRPINRREAGKLAVGALALAQGAAAQGKYTGALDGSEGKVDAAAFDPVLYTRTLHQSAPLRLTFRAQNRRDAEAWQKTLRAKITELLGGFPAKPAALDAQILESK